MSVDIFSVLDGQRFCHGFLQYVLFLVAQRVVRRSVFDRFDVAARVLAGKDAGEDNAVVVRIEQGDGIAEVAPHVLKGAKPHGGDAHERLADELSD